MYQKKRNQKIIMKTLREQVYEYIRDRMDNGEIEPDSIISLVKLSEELGVSNSPLRDAFIQLECDGFVTILPRKGIRINSLSLKDVTSAWEICRALEAEAILNNFEKFDKKCINRMKRLNDRMKKASDDEKYDKYYELNVAFHDSFSRLSDNRPLRKIILLNKQRLYEFHKRAHIKQWEYQNSAEHDRLIELFIQGDCRKAADYIREVHWSYEKQMEFIEGYYAKSTPARGTLLNISVTEGVG